MEKRAATLNGAEDEESERFTQKQCGICAESYALTTPKILPCFHTFCQSCLDEEMMKYANQKTFKCPFCHFEVDIPKDGAAAFQTNLYIRGKKKTALCEVCEDVQEATSRCVNCQQFMCRSCTASHQKWKVMKEHEIETLIGDPGEPQLLQKPKAARTKSRKSRCQLHRTELLDFFCHECRLPACKQCKYIQHKKHKVVDMAELAIRSRAVLTKMLEQNEQYIPWMHRRLTGIETEEKLRERTVIGRIKAHVKSIHRQVDEAAAKLMEEVKVDPGGDKSEAIKSELEVYTQQISSAKAWMQNASDLTLILEETTMKESMESMPRHLSLSINQQYAIDFQCGFLDDVKIKDLVGEVIVNPKMPSELSIHQVNVFEIEGDGVIRCVCPVGRGRSWITEFGSPGMTLYNEKGAVLKYLFPKSFVDSIVVSKKSGYIFASIPEEKKVYKIHPTDGDAALFLELNHHPRGVAISSNEHVIICSTVSKSFQKHKEFHINAIVICNETGDVVRQIQSKESTPFAYPYRVAVNDVGDRLVLLDVVENILHIFNREGSIWKTYDKRDHGRDISDVACDRYGNIFISCCSAGTVELLSSDGQFVCVLLPAGILQGQPHAIAISESGYLWVGFANEIKVFKYLDFKH